MSIIEGILFFTPNSATAAASGSGARAFVMLGVEEFLSGKIDEQQARKKIAPFLSKVKNEPDGKRWVFSLANRIYLAGHPKLAAFLISSVHFQISLTARKALFQNFSYARDLLLGVPYHRGYVGSDGKIYSKYGDKIGLNCITMNNILINLTVGARDYSERLSGDPRKTKETNEDIFTKPELRREGLYPFPIVTNFPAKRIEQLSGLLSLYGDFFTAQLYTADARPFHTVFIFREGKNYRVLDTLTPEGVFADIGELSALVKVYGVEMTYNINLVDSPKARPLWQAKSKKFLMNLQQSVKQAKSE